KGQRIAQADSGNCLCSPLFREGVVCCPDVGRTPALREAELTNNVRRVVVVVLVLFESETNVYTVSSGKVIADRVDFGVVTEVVVLTSETTVVQRYLTTHVEATELDESLTYAGGVVCRIVRRVALEPEFHEAAERAELSFRTSVNLQVGAALLAPAIIVFVNIDLVTDVATNLEAGFGAGNVEEACAVDVANADVFHWLWLWNEDCVSSLSASESHRGDRGAEKKALNVHFLTSSQNR